MEPAGISALRLARKKDPGKMPETRLKWPNAGHILTFSTVPPALGAGLHEIPALRNSPRLVRNGHARVGRKRRAWWRAAASAPPLAMVGRKSLGNFGNLGNLRASCWNNLGGLGGSLEGPWTKKVSGGPWEPLETASQDTSSPWEVSASFLGCSFFSAGAPRHESGPNCLGGGSDRASAAASPATCTTQCARRG